MRRVSTTIIVSRNCLFVINTNPEIRDKRCDIYKLFKRSQSET